MSAEGDNAVAIRAGMDLTQADLGKLGGSLRASARGNFGGWLGSSEPYEGASTTHPDLAGYEPFNWSPQAAASRAQNRLAARTHDMARNDGWATAAYNRQVDSVIGSGWRLTAKPNALALGLDPSAVHDLSLQIESEWRGYAHDADLCDAGQRFTVGALLGLAFRHRVMDGESVGAILWLDRGGDYATALQIVDPDRLSNPFGRIDTVSLRQGVDLGPNGEPIAYHFRYVHPGDVGVINPDMYRWDRVPRTLPNGRRMVAHAFEPHSAGMVRGVPPLAPVIQKLHMLGRYDKAELQAAVLNAVLSAVVTSTDQTQVAEALQGKDPLAPDYDDMSPLQAARVDYYRGQPLRIPGAQISYLYPTDKMELTRPQHPNSGFEVFYRTGLRNIAAATGTSYEQLSTDWSQSNYSSARGALLEVWKGFTARKDNFAHQFMQPFYAAWLEEAIDRGRVKLPKGAPDFRERRQAYCENRWIGPARGWVDPKKEAEAAELRLSIGLTTYEKECADQGEWYVDVIQQRARERKEMINAGLDPDAMQRAKIPAGSQPGDREPPPPPQQGGRVTADDEVDP